MFMLPEPVLQSESTPGERIRHHILTGYRPEGQAWYKYVLGFFQWHNETTNMWTHLISFLWAVYMIFKLWNTYDMSDPYLYPLGACMLTYVPVYLCSTIAHIFSNKSEVLHYVLFYGDYMGISVFGAGAAVAAHHYSVRNPPLQSFLDSYSPYVNVSINIGMFALFCYGKLYHGRASKMSKVTRAIINLLSYLWFLLPIANRISNSEESEAIDFHKIGITFYVISGIFYSSHIPERFLPKVFDNFGQSHNVFHVTMWISGIYILKALRLDMSTVPVDNRNVPTLPNTYGVIGYILLVEMALIPYFGLLTVDKLDQKSNNNNIPEQRQRNNNIKKHR